MLATFQSLSSFWYVISGRLLLHVHASPSWGMLWRVRRALWCQHLKMVTVSFSTNSWWLRYLSQDDVWRYHFQHSGGHRSHAWFVAGRPKPNIYDYVYIYVYNYVMFYIVMHFTSLHIAYMCIFHSGFDMLDLSHIQWLRLSGTAQWSFFPKQCTVRGS